MKALRIWRVWRLRTFLSGLLVLAVVLTVGLVGVVILAVRIPQLEQESQADVARETTELAQRVEILLGALESQVELLSQTLRFIPREQANDLLDRATDNSDGIRAIYLASNNGIVWAAGLDIELRSRRDDLLGSDVSANPLFRGAQFPRQLSWGDKYLSALSGSVTVGLAYPMGSDDILIVEVPLSYLLSTVQLAAGWRSSSIWLVDRSGEIVADTVGGRSVGTTNLLNLPLMQAALKNQPLPKTFSLGGKRMYPAVAHPRALDWYFIAGAPVGLANVQIRNAVLFVLAGLVGSLLVGLLLAPFWASALIRPLRDIVQRAGRITQGDEPGPWPQGHIQEFNHLGADLETLAQALKERQQKTQAIFNASPVPMSVTDTERFALLEVNDAWCEAFDRRREDVIGRTSAELKAWRSEADRDRMRAQLQVADTAEAWMLRGDGRTVLFQLSRQVVQIGATSLIVWAAIDITEARKTEQAVRDLNTDLEARVARRTAALATLNEELSGAIATLRQTQNDLVRSEKMAALGGLVAGVAHELNTPLGNGLMAVTSLADEVRQFRKSMQDGLRRSTLESLLAGMEQGTDIAVRNLHRAADLVSSFKQVAADQTSSQRRPFELAEVVAEMVVSLRPSLNRTPYQIVVAVPSSGLHMNSYPGPLGQVIGNLVNNAVLHAFDGRSTGTIRIEAERGQAGTVVLRLSDDGKGIAPALMDRIFDPFVTTRMGRGGTGLGLHIAFNAVTHLLGGTITVKSQLGLGTTFEMHLPDTAPRHASPGGEAATEPALGRMME